MQSTRYIRFVEPKDGPAQTIMGVDEEAIRLRFGKQLSEIIADHGLPATEMAVPADGTEHRQRIRAAGGGR
ncbi:hypothetical protein [Bordetella sp. LUAb4]|uniref:hypothetical protein n=1 Tax=Bordetella sp. LUAb4 TaxID=2843195 RepID=UPI001E5EF5F9|nr:hypothetical protein [Bordetella sp. LUAb4]